MKSVKKADGYIRMVVVLLAIGAAMSMAGCTSTPLVEQKAKEKYEKMEDKGSAYGVETPRWVIESLNGNSAVQKLYKDMYCFVIEYEDADKEFAVAWVTGASGPQAVAQKVSSSVLAQMEKSRQGEKGSDMEVAQSDTATVLSNASFSGLTKDADWWVTQRNLETQAITTKASALWLIDKKQLDRQITANLQNIMDKNTAMSDAERAIYAALIADITGVGLDNT